MSEFVPTHSIQPSDPPVGQDFTGIGAIVPSTDQWWKLKAFTVNLAASATGATARNVSLIIQDGGGGFRQRIPIIEGVAAGVSLDLSGYIGATRNAQAGTTTSTLCSTVNLPNVWWPPTWKIVTSTQNKVSGDAYTTMQMHFEFQNG